MMICLWLLMLRAIGIELRSHINNAMWQSFFDFIFSGSSLLLALFLGAAIGNVVRGVPLNEEGYFFEALWADFRVGANPGILDWYTVLTSLVALVTLTAHGANYIAMKTSGDINLRAQRVAARTGWALVLLTIVSLIATLWMRPQMLDNYRLRMWGAIFPFMVACSLAAMQYFRAKGRDLAAFLSSAAYIVGMLAGAAFAFYPNLLAASTNPGYSLTIYNSAAGGYGLAVGLVWWSVGIALALGYFVYLYYSFRGKVALKGEGY